MHPHHRGCMFFFRLAPVLFLERKGKNYASFDVRNAVIEDGTVTSETVEKGGVNAPSFNISPVVFDCRVKEYNVTPGFKDDFLYAELVVEVSGIRAIEEAIDEDGEVDYIKALSFTKWIGLPNATKTE